MANNWKTRELTPEESQTLIRRLTIELGSATLAETALRVVGQCGAGIFMATEVKKKAG